MPLTTAGKVTYLFLPRLSFTVTSLPLSDLTASLIELIVRFAFIIQLFLPKFAKLFTAALLRKK